MCFCNETVKCLLIIPNAESALNEEAGRLLLENYDDYAKHARLMTKIHASAKPFDSPSKDGLIKSEDKKDEAIDTKGERKTDVKDGKSDQSEHEPMTNVHSAATSPLGVSNSINEGISLKKNTGIFTYVYTKDETKISICKGNV
ncbi:10388_t:CDS:2 [Paraglomus brasilianum]|uniref:10388_t:CDS:1 n=1 Tax=Paraglomus brasilianum TaxID=144538 RepID=A0A9N9AFY0_9GLOM|nr:10388_t:CDS:2 [Paraglomus brasilianum]